MILKFDKSFEKDILKLKNKDLAIKIKKIITELENIENITSLKNVKKMEGFPSYYRVRIGDYRLGIEPEDSETIVLLRIKHRKDIYDVFP